MTTPLLCIDTASSRVRRYLRVPGQNRPVATDEVIALEGFDAETMRQLEALRTINRLQNLKTQRFSGKGA